jgi:hypothetical protein
VTFPARCSFCLQPVDPAARTTYRRVEGWERKALADSRRSGSDIVLRQPLDEYACPVCISRIQAGLSIAQEALL